jgi:hypothetical protein
LAQEISFFSSCIFDQFDEAGKKRSNAVHLLAREECNNKHNLISAPCFLIGQS